MKQIFVIILAVLSINSLALAARGNLERRIQKAQFTCPDLSCTEINVGLANMSRAEIRSLPTETRETLKNSVVELAQNLWPDTILEGPYENLGRFRIEQVQKLIVDDRHAGYRVTYSDKAWDIDTCDFDPQKPETIKACETGRIYESAFVSLDYKEVFRDETNVANYVPDALIPPQDQPSVEF